MEPASLPPSPRQFPYTLIGFQKVLTDRLWFKFDEAKRKLASLPDLEGEDPLCAPVVVNENTDLRDLSAAQMYDLNQVLYDESIPTMRPLIAEIAPMSALREEYENGSPSFVHQIDWLRNQGYTSIRRTRGDGDCFYRSTAFAFVERLMQDPERDLAVGRALSILESTLPMLELAGFHSLVYDDFYETFATIIENIVKPDKDDRLLTDRSLLDLFQTPEVSNSIVVYLRLLTSAQIRLAPDDFEAVLFHPETAEQLDTRQFCEGFVEASGKEADHVQMIALCRALQLNIDVAYLDGRRPDGIVDFIPIRSADENIKPLVLLYRPGHYDILVGQNKK